MDSEGQCINGPGGALRPPLYFYRLLAEVLSGVVVVKLAAGAK
jgi:hypothetical protein